MKPSGAATPEGFMIERRAYIRERRETRILDAGVRRSPAYLGWLVGRSTRTRTFRLLSRTTTRGVLVLFAGVSTCALAGDAATEGRSDSATDGRVFFALEAGRSSGEP
jgi:hypothetical protein